MRIRFNLVAVLDAHPNRWTSKIPGKNANERGSVHMCTLYHIVLHHIVTLSWLYGIVFQEMVTWWTLVRILDVIHNVDLNTKGPRLDHALCRQIKCLLSCCHAWLVLFFSYVTFGVAREQTLFCTWKAGKHFYVHRKFLRTLARFS